MASADNHYRQAQLNFLHLRDLFHPNAHFRADWVVTVCFYCAVHLINGYLAGFQLHPKTHQETERVLNRINKPRHIPISSYAELKNLSHQTRYIGSKDMTYPHIPNVDHQDVTDSLEYLEDILHFIRKHYHLHPKAYPTPTIHFEGKDFFG
jgi:hypothetical protein